MIAPSITNSALSEVPPGISDHELVRCIGRGSYGQVWLGRSMMGAWRAVKVIYRGEEGASGFQRELAGIRKFEPVSRSSAGLVHILQVGQDPAQRYFYYVMELADDGQRQEPWSFSHASAVRDNLNPETFIPRTLSLERRRRGRLSAPECLEIAIALTNALVSLHEHGLVHRDIKPSNIIFVNGEPKLADIGLVAEMSEATSYVGTEGYIAPEGPNSPQGDIYSFGKVLYEISTGKDRQDFPEPVTILEPDEQKLSQELNAVILKACAPEPSGRYKSASQMAADLQLIRDGRSVRAERVQKQRRVAFTWVGVVAIVITLAVLVGEKFLDSRVESMQGQSTLIRPELVGKVPPRDPATSDAAVDLSAYYNAPLVSAWYPGPDANTLDALPRGRQQFGGVTFDVRGLVQLNGAEISSYQAGRTYPRQVKGIPIDRFVSRLHFLQGAVSEVPDGATIGQYVLEFASGRVAQVPVIFGKDVRALWQPGDSSGVASNSLVAWQGQNRATRDRDMVLRLYKRTWENPWPDDQIVDISFISKQINSAPFLVALSLDAHTPANATSHLDLIASLQGNAAGFQVVQPALTPTRDLSTFKLKAHPANIGNEYFDGFRFTTPAGKPVDLVWAFDERKNFGSQGWRIFPVKGRMKVGFEDWYHGSSPEDEKIGAQLRVQYLAGRKLQPATEYIIAFTFNNAEPVDLSAVFRFAPTGEVNPNRPETLVGALGLQGTPRLKVMTFHRHFCLGNAR